MKLHYTAILVDEKSKNTYLLQYCNPSKDEEMNTGFILIEHR